jgi:hypothetical protein
MKPRTPRHRRSIIIALGALLAACVHAPPPSLYERVATHLAQRSDLAQLGAPPVELQQVSWMIGTWDIEATVFATTSAPERVDRGRSVVTPVIGGTWLQMADTYPGGTQDLGFLTFDPVGRRWLSLGLDSTGNAVRASAPAWDGDRLALLAGDAIIVGEHVSLRQTLTRLGPDAFTLSNEERRPDGSWLRLDEYRFRRASE